MAFFMKKKQKIFKNVFKKFRLTSQHYYQQFYHNLSKNDQNLSKNYNEYEKKTMETQLKFTKLNTSLTPWKKQTFLKNEL